MLLNYLFGHCRIAGRGRLAIVIGHGSAGRAAVTALQAAGFSDLTVFTQRDPVAIKDSIPGVNYRRYAADPRGGEIAFGQDGRPRRFVTELRSVDIIVNCCVQDPEMPVMFVSADEIEALDHVCLIIDISCDLGMGFPFARTTTFEKPTFKVGRITVCAVDHTPAYLWDAATWGISNAILPHVPTIAADPNCWRESSTISDAIEIENGMILNKKIISFQGRSKIYPFRRRERVWNSEGPVNLHRQAR